MSEPDRVTTPDNGDASTALTAVAQRGGREDATDQWRAGLTNTNDSVLAGSFADRRLFRFAVSPTGQVFFDGGGRERDVTFGHAGPASGREQSCLGWHGSLSATDLCTGHKLEWKPLDTASVQQPATTATDETEHLLFAVGPNGIVVQWGLGRATNTTMYTSGSNWTLGDGRSFTDPGRDGSVFISLRDGPTGYGLTSAPLEGPESTQAGLAGLLGWPDRS